MRDQDRRRRLQELVHEVPRHKASVKTRSILVAITSVLLVLAGHAISPRSADLMFVSKTAKEINLRIVFYGVSNAGKGTTLQYIHDHIGKKSKGKMISIATSTEKTMFFDLVPQGLGEVNGYRIRLHLYGLGRSRQHVRGDAVANTGGEPGAQPLGAPPSGGRRFSYRSDLLGDDASRMGHDRSADDDDIDRPFLRMGEISESRPCVDDLVAGQVCHAAYRTRLVAVAPAAASSPSGAARSQRSGLDQELIEPREQRGAPDEARVSCSFCREVEPCPLRRRGRGYRGSVSTRLRS